MKRSKPINSSVGSKPSQPSRQTVGELHELQRLMAATLMRPLTPAGQMQPRWVDGRAMKQLAATFIKPHDRLTSIERLEIYNRQYWFRLWDCFHEDYPGLRAVLGERKFARLAVAYLTKHPSRSFTLRNLGRDLVRYLEAEPEWVLPEFQLAHDMARLEWAHIEAFDNEAKPALTSDQLLDQNPARLRLRLQPHVTLLELHYPLDNFLIAVKQAAGLRGAASNAKANRRRTQPRTLKRRLKPERTFFAAHRYNQSVYYKRLKAEQFVLLRALQEGTTLEGAVQQVLEMPASRNIDAQTVQHWFEDWSALGWFWIMN